MIKISIEASEDKTSSNIDAKMFTASEIGSMIAQLELLKLDLISKLAKQAVRKQ